MATRTDSDSGFLVVDQARCAREWFMNAIKGTNTGRHNLSVNRRTVRTSDAPEVRVEHGVVHVTTVRGAQRVVSMGGGVGDTGRVVVRRG